MSKQKILALIIGFVCLTLGILSFSNILVVNSVLFFQKNLIKTTLYLIGGAVGIYSGTKGEGKGYNMVIGWISLLLGIFGFIPGMDSFVETSLGLNYQSAIFHIIIGVVSLGVFYMDKK